MADPVETAEYHAMMREQIDMQRIRQDMAIAVAKNVTTNGRWFSALVCLANIGAGNPKLAIAAAAPVGLAAICDQLPAGRARSAFSFAIYGLAASVAILSLMVG